MQRGGPAINQRTAQIMRLAGVITPFLLFIYGIFVHYQLVDTSHYAGDTPFLIMIVPWVLYGIYQFIFPSRTLRASAIRFTVFHLFAAIYLIYISGFATPFAITWVLLFLSVYAYFGNFGLRVSVFTFILIGELDIMAHPSNHTIIVTNSLMMFAVLVVGLTAVAIARVQEIDGAEFARTKALESLQRDRVLTIINNLADAVMSTDENGVIRVYNAACLNLLDTNANLNGQRIDDVIKIFEAKKQVNLLQLLRDSTGVVIRDDLTMPIEDETIRLEITYSPIRSNYRGRKRKAKDGFIVILRDITKAKSLEEERDEFISVVSHELRTPITITEGTISNVQLMMERHTTDKKVLGDALAMAHEQVVYLSKMVNDLSTLSRAERGVADTAETIEVRGLVDDLYHEYAPQAEARHLHFDLDLDSHLGQVTASRLYLKELLQNFITNAIKYTKEGGVTLAVKRKEDSISFEIRDTGIGISRSDQTKIFTKFYRSEDYRTRETSGTGLGLYVAAKLAKKLGTKIEMKSRLNHGSSFSIELPSSSDTTG